MPTMKAANESARILPAIGHPRQILKGARRRVDGYAMERVQQIWSRVPRLALVLLGLLLAAGPAGLALSQDTPRAAAGTSLSDTARKAGCTLRENEDGMVTNPPVTGRRIEQSIAADGSHIGRRAPAINAIIHSLLHGRVLIQYRPGLPDPEVRALDRLVRDDSDRVVGFENQTGMTAPVAATAYLSLLTCPRVDAATLHALSVFRDRRRGFGTAF
jgi:hypothetical protein